MLKKGTKVLLIGAAFWYFGEGMFGPLLAVFAEQVGGSLFDVSWAWSAYLLMYGVLSIFIGLLSDIVKSGKEKMMVLGYGLNAVFTFGYLFVDNTFDLLLVQAGLGVAAALATPTWNALYDEFSAKNLNGRAWGASEGMASIITALSIVIGAYIVTYSSFETLFIAMGVIQVAATLYQAKIMYV